MEKFVSLTSRIIPLPMKDVDTDLIIPAQYLTSTSRAGYADHLFERLRASDSNFVTNRPEYKGCSILVADSNFGCGSSREHAVWALLGAGIKVVIAKSFADIFSGNSAKNGLLLITLPDKDVDVLLTRAAEQAVNLSVDLGNQRVSGDGLDIKFDYDPFRKHCLLEGLDDFDYIISHKKEIEEYWKRRSKDLFFATTKPNR